MSVPTSRAARSSGIGGGLDIGKGRGYPIIGDIGKGLAGIDRLAGAVVGQPKRDVQPVGLAQHVGVGRLDLVDLARFRLDLQPPVRHATLTRGNIGEEFVADQLADPGFLLVDGDAVERSGERAVPSRSP